MSGLTLVLPVRNEAAAVGPLLRAARASLGGLLRKVVLVDDASADGTAEAAEAAWRAIPPTPGAPGWEILRMAERVGRGASFRAAAPRAEGEFVAYMDADLQFHPGDLRRAAALARAGADVVCGARVEDPGVPPLRTFLSVGFRAAAHAIAGLPCVDPLCGFKLFRRAVLADLLAACADPHWYFDFEVMLRARSAGLRIADLPLVFDRAAAGHASKTDAVPLVLEYLGKLWRDRRVLARAEGAAGDA